MSDSSFILQPGQVVFRFDHQIIVHVRQGDDLTAGVVAYNGERCYDIFTGKFDLPFGSDQSVMYLSAIGLVNLLAEIVDGFCGTRPPLYGISTREASQPDI